MNFGKMKNALSLTPGFSPVISGGDHQNRFNGFFRAGKPLKRLARRGAFNTRLKPGANESERRSAGFQTCCIADFQIRQLLDGQRPADLEIGDTADWEVCAT
jgi:hypothetical protein